MVAYEDPSDDLHDLVNTNWDTGIVAKPVLVQSSAATNVKFRKKHSSNTVYFFGSENERPVYHQFHRDLYWRVPVALVGTSWAQVKLVKEGYDDAIHEYLDDAGRTYQHIGSVVRDTSARKPRDRWWFYVVTTMTKFAEDITT